MRPQPEQPFNKPPSIEPVLSMAMGHNQALLMKDISTVHLWLNEGCDLYLDILPVMKSIIEKREKINRNKIGSFSYFTNAIRESRDKRSLVPKLQKQPSQDELDEIRAANIRWHKERGLTTTRVGLQDFDWLERYEHKKKGENMVDGRR